MPAQPEPPPVKAATAATSAPVEPKPKPAPALETMPAQPEPPPVKAATAATPAPSKPEPKAAPVAAVAKPAKTAPTGASVLHQQGRQLLQEGQFAAAIQKLSEALELDPTLALALNARGYAHFRLKQVPEALADFDQALKINSGYVNAYQNRAAARRAAGDKAGADADLGKARELAPAP
jgi:tetratricopeptide (TPR) repeat protein